MYFATPMDQKDEKSRQSRFGKSQSPLLDVLANQAGHFKHGNLGLAKDFL